MTTQDLTPNSITEIPMKEKVIPDEFETPIASQISGWNNSSDELSSGKLKLQSTAERILIGDATAPMTGIGIFMGLDGSDYEFRAGDPDTNYLHWNGTNLSVAGITLTGGTINYGKTTFADATNAGYYLSSAGWYVGSALDATRFKYTLADGTLDFIGTHSGGSVGGIGVTQIAYATTSTADAVPTGLTASATGITTATDGTISAYVTLTWTAISSNTFDHYLIRFKKASYTYYTQIPANTNTITIDGLVPNVSYNFGIASVNKYGTSSAFSSDISQTTASDSTAPATVTGVTAVGAIQYALIEWTALSIPDLSHYNIYRNTINDSATATKIASVKTTYFVDGNLSATATYYYWVKCQDTSGNESTAFSDVASATPRNVTSDDVVTLAGSKVLIDGTTYLSNWRKTGDLTKIDGGSISTNTITTTQLNFTPVQSTDVIAKINSSAEGITIDADNLTINAATTFASGYDPTGRVLAVGGSYDSAASGARVRIFPDANTGIQVIDNATADVFKCVVGGTDVGDVIIGNYSGGQGIFYDKSANSTTFAGILSATTGTFASLYTNSADGLILDYGSNILLKEGGSINFTSVAAPVACTATLVETDIGNINDGNHKYAVTFVNDYGETQLGEESATVTVDATHKQVDLTAIPVSSSSSVTARKIYRTKIDSSMSFFLLTTINNNTETTYTDNTADANLTGSDSLSRENSTLGRIVIDDKVSLYLGPYNTLVGQLAGNSNTIGSFNVAIGNSSLFSNTIGYNNVSVGGFSLYFNTSGHDNTAVGNSSLYDNTSGNGNVAIGSKSLSSNTSGIGNVAIGIEALGDNTTGSNNVAVGNAALYYSEAEKNTAIGAGALRSNQTGTGNVAIGYQAGYYETGSNKLFIDNWARASEADARVKALIYGVFNATALNQQITFNVGTLNILDGGNIATGTGTGLKLGTATSQKLGFFGVNPVDQPATVADATDAPSVILRCNDIIDRLQELGLIA